MLDEEVLALGTSCSHSRPGSAAQQAGCTRRLLAFLCSRGRVAIVRRPKEQSQQCPQ
jgi:hypothetical protein